MLRLYIYRASVKVERGGELNLVVAGSFKH